MTRCARPSPRPARRGCRSASTSARSCSGRQRTFPAEFASGRDASSPIRNTGRYRLTGVLANEVTSLGCHTDLWNPAPADFSTLVDTQGWRPLMAPMRRAGDRARPAAARHRRRRPGLPAGTPVYCGIHDSNASLLPHLLRAGPPFSVVSTGTWVIAMAIGGAAVELDPARDTLVNVNALGDPVPSARFMGGREFSLLTEGRRKTERSGYRHVLARKTSCCPRCSRAPGRSRIAGRVARRGRHPHGQRLPPSRSISR